MRHIKGLRRIAAVASAAMLVPLGLAGCTGTPSPSAGGDASGGISGQTISYWLWDSNQQPVYQQCADDFAKQSGVTVKIQQYAWPDYWKGITTGFASGTAPDVFADHLSYFPQFVSQGQLVNIADKVKADKLDLSIYQDGLADLWVGQDGGRYGLPKDFDTVALFYNQKMIKDAGYTADQLKTLTWNPTDGGTYEKLLAHLTIDKNGKRGDEAGFDKTKVKVYALAMNADGLDAGGQTSWSPYALSNNWTYGDKTPWTTSWNYGSPQLAASLTWYKSLIEKGYMETLEAAVSEGSPQKAFLAGRYALTLDGDWMSSTYLGQTAIPTGVFPTPIGPDQKRASLFNGLSDGIWAGSKQQDAAWAWVKYTASAACQDVVAKSAVVFPAIKTSTTLAEKAFTAKGWDISAFTVHVQDGTTHLLPIADHWSDVNDTFKATLQSFLKGSSDASAFATANDKINALFK